ncbi:ATP-binding protein [Thermocoleostomius sinensis]|uniref:Circadian input-output histidine kinase CikA n=1 Tax=Thermocoleostomius sinensis A174 TaxID=2016057 RepID=A0A9E8ZH39_9CYAN|nr:ATP-binding protein [Thermocoleostomius sinensis]WAL62646.1 ATP-binding protein [Thermocoleostomius sinensis A174]
MNGDEFIDQIQDVQQRVAEFEQNAKQLPPQQKSRLTESLERLTAALRDLQMAEEAIRLLLSAVQQSRDSIIITTAQLNPPGPEIVYVNPAFSEMTGYRSEDVLGKTPRILQGPETDRTVLDKLRTHLAQGKPFHGEAINYRKDRTPFYVEWNITPIRNGNQTITHFVAIQRDIDDRKRSETEREQLLQQEQQARAEAELANRSKDEFLATLSHELRTPLTPILGWTKVLQTKQLSADKYQEALDAIEQSAKRQAQLVDDLLDLSRIVQGKLTLNLTFVSLITPIAAALETVGLSADAKSIRLETNLDPTVGQIMGDVGRLQQVIWNLLSNAIKFTPEGGQIYVGLERVDRYAQITIRDTGQGIDPDLLPFIFERFRQGDGSITRQYGGLGLGLSIARQLVEAHGGTITAASQGNNQGATFTVRLPLVSHSPSFKLSIAPTMQRFDLSGIRVLVVEDEPATLKFIAFVLEQEGATVTAVTSAQAALDALEFNTVETSPFDVLVCDIGMQDMDGYTLLRQIRSSSAPYQSIYAIALTAYATEANRQQSLVAGFQQHLAKPIEPAMLAAAIATEVRQCG